MIYIGIDPGEGKGNPGAVAILNTFATGFNISDTIEIHDCPQTDKEMVDILELYDRKYICIAIEKASKIIRIDDKTYHATVLWGNYRAWLMACCCLQLKVEIVPPRTWQSKILDGNKKLSTKDRAWEAACRLYPEVSHLLKGPRGGKKYGRSDAIGIMEYGRRFVFG